MKEGKSDGCIQPWRYIFLLDFVPPPPLFYLIQLQASGLYLYPKQIYKQENL